MDLRAKLCLFLIVGCHLLAQLTATYPRLRRTSRAGGILCYQCSDKWNWGIPMSPFGVDPDACSRMHPKAVRRMRCASNEDICAKTIIYGAGGPQASNVVTRQCMSLSSLRHHNMVLNITQKYLTDRCYDDNDFPSPSPPYKHRFCVCHANFCNSATSLSSEYPLLTTGIVVLVYIGFIM